MMVIDNATEKSWMFGAARPSLGWSGGSQTCGKRRYKNITVDIV